MRNSVTAALVCLMTSTTGEVVSSQQLSGEARYSIPSTMSPVAAKDLETVYAILKQRPVAQKPVSLADWDRNEKLIGESTAHFFVELADRLGVTRTNESMGGVPVVRIRPPGWKPTGRTLVYIHGGAYVSSRATYALSAPAQVVTAGGDEVISIDYTLAPRSRWRQTTDQVLAVWQALLASHHSAASIGMMGDSAGGGLVAGSVLKMRDKGLPLPGALYLMSPWSDLTGAGDTITTLAGADPILSETSLKWDADAYADPADQKQPYVSPVYGDYSKAFPPTLIQGGTREIFISDEIRLYRAISSGGHDAVLDLYEGMPHVHQIATAGSPEATAAIARGVNFLHAHLKADK